MARSYLPVDRDQMFLLPPSMRDWLPEGHLVWFVLDVVARLDTSALHARHPNDGVGRRAYDPDMLLALLIYAYSSGIRSSRQIERLCQADVAFRIVCGGLAPDHTTIARFRQDHAAQSVKLFTDVLVLCAEAGLARLGTVAVDGTKMGAAASLGANRTRAQVEAEVAAIFSESEAADDEEDRLFGAGRGDELPPELADPRRRGARLDAALRQIERQAAARRAEAEAAAAARRSAWQRHKEEAEAAGRAPHGGAVPEEFEVEAAEAALARQEDKAAARVRRRAEAEAAAAAAGRRLRGVKPDPFNHRDVRDARSWVERAKARAAQRVSGRTGQQAATEDRANTTDPESRIMKTAQGWVQGYNAQAAVNDCGVTIAAYVTTDANDVHQCLPMMEALAANLAAAAVPAEIGVVLFDAGYWSEANATAPGPERLIATSKSWKLVRKAKLEGARQGPPPQDAGTAEAMEHRLLTEEGMAQYAKRGATIERTFGDLKENRGFRRFMRRGLAAVNAEWKLMHTTANILTLFRHGALTPLT